MEYRKSIILRPLQITHLVFPHNDSQITLTIKCHFPNIFQVSFLEVKVCFFSFATLGN